MAVAFLADDPVTISQHFGSAALVVVVHKEGAGQGAKEVLQPDPQAGGRFDQRLALIGDAEVVVAGGMGLPAYERLEKLGKRVLLTSVRSIDEAFRAIQDGSLVHEHQIAHDHNHDHHGHSHDHDHQH
jgi:predicted Fe-Mo cluster-binding NifX family protein